MKKIPALLLSLGLATSSLVAQDLPSNADVGYAFGVLTGQNVAGSGMAFDLDQYIAGFKDGTTPGATPKMTADQAKELLSRAYQALQVKLAQPKIDAEKTWLAAHAKQSGVITTASGLQYEVLVSAHKAQPKATDIVTVNYVGTLTDGTEFDSSIKRNEPASFALNEVIPAWTEGIQLMGVGDKFRFTIPSNLAYGAQGAGDGVIPPYATLQFEVELLSFQAPPPPEPAPAPAQ